jgi:hypothetical protein
MLMCDGSIILSDTIEPGPNGFLQAKWLHDGSILELEVPNVCMDAIEDTASAPVSKPRSKRGLVAKAARATKAPKKDARASKATDVEELGGGGGAPSTELGSGGGEEFVISGVKSEATDHVAEGSVRMKVAAGHGTRMTIVAYTSAKDKAQILEVSAEHCANTDKTPTWVCYAIIDKMRGLLATTTGLVHENDVQGLRQIARDLRKAVLA